MTPEREHFLNSELMERWIYKDCDIIFKMFTRLSQTKSEQEGSKVWTKSPHQEDSYN